MRFKDKVAFICGAGASSPGWSNGKAVSVLLAREGAKIFALDFKEENLAPTVETIQSEGGVCVTHTADVTSQSDIQAAVAACMKKWGRIDILFNNVGLQSLGGPEELEEEV